MKNSLSKKLMTCMSGGMGFLASAIMFSSGAYAQIVYTDVNPDVVRGCSYPSPCGAAFSIDLNNDGINDFTFAPKARAFSCGRCSPNAVGVLGTRDSALVISTAQSWISDTIGGFDLNRPIDSSLSWTNTVHTLAQNGELCKPCPSRPGLTFKSTLGITGTFKNVSGKYVGLKVKVGSDFYYGWVNLGVSIASYSVSIKIMEYAFNATPNQPILAGQTMVTSMNKNLSPSSIALYPNPANNQFTVDLGSHNQNVKVTVSDLTGKTMVETFAIGSQKLEVDTRGFKAGTYVVQIQSADFTGTKRLIIAK